MKTYSEYFNESGVVSLMFENNKTEAVNIFGDISHDEISLIDEYFDFNIGDRYIFSKIENKTPSKIALMLLLKYSDLWVKIKKNLGIVYSVAEPSKTTETTNATTNNETTSTILDLSDIEHLVSNIGSERTKARCTGTCSVNGICVWHSRLQTIILLRRGERLGFPRITDRKLYPSAMCSE